MVVPKIQSAHNSEARNIINKAIEVLNVQGKTIQDLVADGQLTPEQYAQLITIVDNNLKSGEIDLYDLDDSLRSEVEKVNDKINRGDVSINDLSPGVLEAIHNGDGTPFEILSIPRDGSVGPKKTTFITQSSNLFDKNDMNKGYSINSSTGQPVVNTDYSISNKFISVEPNTPYVFSPTPLRYAFYDKNFNFLTSSITSSFTSPVDAYNLKLAVRTDNLETAQLNKGTELLSYEPFYYKLAESMQNALPKGNINLIYQDGKLVEVRESGDITKLIYNQDGRLQSVEERKTNEVVESILNYDTNGILQNISRVKGDN